MQSAILLTLSQRVLTRDARRFFRNGRGKLRSRLRVTRVIRREQTAEWAEFRTKYSAGKSANTYPRERTLKLDEEPERIRKASFDGASKQRAVLLTEKNSTKGAVPESCVRGSAQLVPARTEMVPVVSRSDCNLSIESIHSCFVSITRRYRARCRCFEPECHGCPSSECVHLSIA